MMHSFSFFFPSHCFWLQPFNGVGERCNAVILLACSVRCTYVPNSASILLTNMWSKLTQIKGWRVHEKKKMKMQWIDHIHQRMAKINFPLVFMLVILHQYTAFHLLHVKSQNHIKLPHAYNFISTATSFSALFVQQIQGY